MIEVGRIKIKTKVSLFSFHTALPSEGCLDATVHVMAYVGQKYNSRLMYDLSYPETDHSVVKKYNWLEFYKNAKEDIPTNAPVGGMLFTTIIYLNYTIRLKDYHDNSIS